MYPMLLPDPEEDHLIRERRGALALPFSLQRIVSASLSTLKAHRAPRCWALPETSFADEVKHYYDRHTALALRGPQPRLRRDLAGDPGPEELATRVDIGLRFLEMGAEADPLCKPILLYYSCISIVSAFTRCFFHWDQDRRTHGLHYPPGQTELAVASVKIEDRGQFGRLATTCFLLSGMPSCFCELVTYSVGPEQHTQPGGLLERFGATEKADRVRSLTLDELCSFDYAGRLKAVRTRHGFHKFNGLPGTALLVDYIALFVASALARYDLVAWRRILEGRDNEYRLSFDEVFERFETFTADLLLMLMADPLQRLDARLRTHMPSPYSRDHHRYPTDPNHQP